MLVKGAPDHFPIVNTNPPSLRYGNRVACVFKWKVQLLDLVSECNIVFILKNEVIEHWDMDMAVIICHKQTTPDHPTFRFVRLFSPRLDPRSTGITETSPGRFGLADSSGCFVFISQKHNGTFHTDFWLETRHIDWNIPAYPVA